MIFFVIIVMEKFIFKCVSNTHTLNIFIVIFYVTNYETINVALKKNEVKEFCNYIEK